MEDNVLNDMEDDAGGQAPTTPDNSDKPPVDPKVKNFVTLWTKRIKSAKKHWAPAFKQMDQCMQLAKDGAEKEWAANKNNYTVPILNRLTGQAVAQLYARHPETYAKRKKRRMFTVWDGTVTSLLQAQQAIQANVQQNTMAAQNAGQMGQPQPMPVPPDPNAVAIIADAARVKAYDTLLDGIADTLTILHNHYLEEQSAQYKSQFKALVRRVKVVGVGYVKLCYQRILEKNPDVTVKIAETTEQLATLRALIAEAADEDMDAESAQAEQIQTLLADLQAQETLLVSEGPLYSFPKPKSIIIDPRCQHLKTLAGAGWIAEEFEKNNHEILTDYKVDVKGQFTEYKPDDTEGRWEKWNDEVGEMTRENVAKVWRVMNRETGQEFTICEGYPDYLVPPAAPAVKIARFFDIFPLVFQEVESETELYPPSDIWLARHMQNEYNRTREFLREHRLQNRPAYITGMGVLEEKDLDKLQSHASGEILVLTQLAPGEKVEDKIMAKPVMKIDPSQYEVDSIWSDILRVTGDQQADAGPTTTSTATESSIAEQGRTVGLSDSVDDIDDMLSLLTQATGQVMLQHLSKQTVEEIVGPGAVWPDAPQTRQDIAEEISLDIRTGSSGRPNKAQDLQNMQAAMPFVVQLPGVNPTPFAEKMLGLLDIDAEDAVVEGMPSIQAANAMASAPPPPGAAPGAQGPHGGQNAPKAPGTTPAPHAAPPPLVAPGHIGNGAPGGAPLA